MLKTKHLAIAGSLVLTFVVGHADARWLSVDPVQADPNTGQNFNRYYYANNNPYKYIDPDGREAGAAFRVVNNATNGGPVDPPPHNPNAPNLVEWGAVEVLCGFCDLNAVAPNGSGVLQPVVTPIEMGTAEGAVVVGKVALTIAKDPKALVLAASLATGDDGVAEALKAVAQRRADAEVAAEIVKPAKATPPPPPPPKPIPTEP